MNTKKYLKKYQEYYQYKKSILVNLRYLKGSVWKVLHIIKKRLIKDVFSHQKNIFRLIQLEI